MDTHFLGSDPLPFILSRLNDDSFKLGAGRRAHVAYRDFGINAATSGKLNFIGAKIRQESKIETGWHYHTCELLIAYYVSGWIDVYFEPGKLVRVSAGDCIMIPRGMPHCEIRNSDDMELVEVYLGEMGTVNVPEPPAGYVWPGNAPRV
jgi:quercetin dioxygenase-like cupin family protein